MPHKAWKAVECGPVHQVMESQQALGEGHWSSHVCGLTFQWMSWTGDD